MTFQYSSARATLRCRAARIRHGHQWIGDLCHDNAALRHRVPSSGVFGNATYNTGTSPAIAYFVRTTSVTTLGALPGSPITYGGTVTFTSTVTAGTTGTVNFESSLNDIAFTSITGCGAEVLSVSSVATCVTNALPTDLITSKRCTRVTRPTHLRRARPSITRSPPPDRPQSP